MLCHALFHTLGHTSFRTLFYALFHALFHTLFRTLFRTLFDTWFHAFALCFTFCFREKGRPLTPRRERKRPAQPKGKKGNPAHQVLAPFPPSIPPRTRMHQQTKRNDFLVAGGLPKDRLTLPNLRSETADLLITWKGRSPKIHKMIGNFWFYCINGLRDLLSR